MKNLLTALLCRLLVAAFCSSGLLSLPSVADAAPRESDGAGAGGADKGKDANKTRPNEPGREGRHFCTAWPSGAALCLLVHDAFVCSVEGTESLTKIHVRNGIVRLKMI